MAIQDEIVFGFLVVLGPFSDTQESISICMHYRQELSIQVGIIDSHISLNCNGFSRYLLNYIST